LGHTTYTPTLIDHPSQRSSPADTNRPGELPNACHPHINTTSTLRDTDPTTESTVLFVDPVVLMVPDTLYAQKVLIGGGVSLACQRVNEEVLRFLPVP